LGGLKYGSIISGKNPLHQLKGRRSGSSLDFYTQSKKPPIGSLSNSPTICPNDPIQILPELQTVKEKITRHNQGAALQNRIDKHPVFPWLK